VLEAADTFFGSSGLAAPPPDGLRAFATGSRATPWTAWNHRSADRRDGRALAARTHGSPRSSGARMAVCELLRGPGTPPAVIINEALELARTFSTEDAVKFINGMLDGVRKKIAP
jgi:hypothetical protein